MEDTAMNDAGMPDASMMGAEIDDLFGDAAGGLASDGLGVAMPSPALPPSLVSRITDMQTRGCCTKLVWSSAGSVARIAEDGKEIHLHVLARHPKTGVWALTKASKQPIVAPEGIIWEHLQFSGTGLDLAAADNFGSVHMFTWQGKLNHMPPTTHITGPPINARPELDAAVGLHWLAVYPAEFRIPYITPATKSDDKWVTEVRHRNAQEKSVHHAADGKGALLYVSCNAHVTLMYRQEQTWRTTSTKLEDIDSSSQLLTHAAFGDDSDCLLLVTHDVARTLRFYKLSIAWNAVTQPNGRPGVPDQTSVSPTLSVAHFTALENVAAQQANTSRLSSLRLVPAISNVADPAAPTVPTVVAVFTRAHLPPDPSQQQQESFSVIARWHVETTIPTLHTSFRKSQSNGATPPQIPITVLRRQEDILTHKLVLSVESQYFHTMLAVCASDGTIEFRERITMTSIEPYPDVTSVSSLPQTGFEHTVGDHNTHTAMSADGSVLAVIKPSGALTTKAMVLRYSWQPLEDGMSDTRGLVEAAVVCLARQYAILSVSNAANDETLSLIPADLPVSLKSLFIRTTTLMTHRTLDIALQDYLKIQSRIALFEALIPRAFSAQLVLAVHPTRPAHHTLAGTFAHALLTLRSIICPLATICTRPEIQFRPEHIAPLVGLVKHGQAFCVWLADSLFAALRLSKKTSPPPSAADLPSLFAARANNPAFHLLLNALTRAHIRMLAVTLPRSIRIAHRHLETTRDPSQKAAVDDLVAAAEALPVNFQTLENLVVDVDGAVRKIITEGEIGAERRIEMEFETCVEMKIPAELEPVVQQLMAEWVPRLERDVRGVEVYFWDTGAFGMGGAVAWERDAWRVDAVLKTAMPPRKGGKGKDGEVVGGVAGERFCRRCGAVMGDLSPETLRVAAPWVANAQRGCICLDFWAGE